MSKTDLLSWLEEDGKCQGLTGYAELVDIVGITGADFTTWLLDPALYTQHVKVDCGLLVSRISTRARQVLQVRADGSSSLFVHHDACSHAVVAVVT